MTENAFPVNSESFREYRMYSKFIRARFNVSVPELKQMAEDLVNHAFSMSFARLAW